MKSKLEEDFLACLKRLPDAVRQTARKNYRLWLDDPRHPSLAFKQIGATGVWSVRVGIGCRALSLVDDDTITPGEDEAWTAFSLAQAMRGLEDEPDLYSQADIRNPRS